MAKRRKIPKTVTFDPAVLKALDSYAEKERIDRSTVVNWAVESFLIRDKKHIDPEYLFIRMEEVFSDLISSKEVRDFISKKVMELIEQKNKPI